MDPLTMRFAERLTALVIGGLAIYLGYRLFSAVPEIKDSSGNFKLPWNISIVLTRVGPGVFFALFGSAAVYLTLAQPLKMEQNGGKITYASKRVLDLPSSSADGRALLRREMAYLNTLPHQLRPDLASQDRRDIERGLRRTKALLIKPVWGQPNEGFGDFASFESWVENDERDPPPAEMAGALELYRYGSEP
jgi:hypothetical protein